MKTKPTHHEIKIESPFFHAVLSGDKTFEIRKNDRDYKVGDTLVLDCHGRKSPLFEITYLTNYAQRNGYVVFSFVASSKEIGCA
ncbi:DUF3850 domain-containing protein [Vibrio nigripulchritudo]|uniref:DUF3850 domain-containing protein n=1 Tax=Vibrio nigripulchritudo TaxID=28173 RepID=UPI0024903D2A|nr:DUF3850 domain-containing protein [Vibrio nigripulchritudo]BDU37170.1 hypothetical protein TUMSATVNIG2_16390 [Vibrio nigripulchritudo]